MVFKKLIYTVLLLVAISAMSCDQQNKTTSYFTDDNYLEQNYSKAEYRIEMRDGIKLHTVVFSPNEVSEKYPILIWRTPYSAGPYGDSAGYNNNRRYAWNHFVKEKFIIVFQDVRGRFMSEGDYVNMRPVTSDNDNKSVDESTDTYDTIDWLVKNISNNNGNVGMWGISYPGFYAAVGAINAHPALKAVSPQAPIADWFVGDDMHHNGAFSLGPGFGFNYVFGQIRHGLVDSWPAEFEFPTNDGYKFLLGIGPLKNVNAEYFKDSVPFWNEMMQHGTYDEFWQSRSTLKHLKNIKPASLIVGGFFDAENLWGALNTYRAIEENSPGAANSLVMGPWYHGGWVRSAGDSLGKISFDSQTRDYYANNIELPFFNYYLKNKGELNLAEANIFVSGSNEWHKFESWPPAGLSETSFYFGSNGSLNKSLSVDSEESFSEYISDPANPVPFTKEITTDTPKPYMVEDQSFVADREDVLSFQTDILTEDLTMLGKITVDLFVSTTGTDCDFVVKVIDVIPAKEMSSERAFQMLLRGDIMRAKFRNSMENPEPMIPNEVTNIKFDLNDVAHTFKKGHRIMVQIQSSWFPLFDRNPQKFVDIYNASESDFQKATQRIYFSGHSQSKIVFQKY